MQTLLQDLRYGARMLLKKPGFTFVAIITLALGIGANTAIFSVVNAVLLRPLPYPEPEKIIQLWETSRTRDLKQGSVSPHCFNDWRTQNESFEQMAAYRYANFTLTGGDQPESITAIATSSSLFSILGVKPAIGRDFLAEEDAPGKNRVVILSQGAWTRLFGADKDILDKSIQLNGESYTVIGVMPKDFQYPDSADMWTPLAIDLSKVGRGTHFLSVIGRLKASVPVAAAQSEMDSIASHLEQQYPDTNSGAGIELIPLHEQMVKRVKDALMVLLVAVGLVLLIACANVANLLLVRATSRQKEIAIRTALGASRWRLVRQFLTEGVLLSVLGGSLGLLIAWWGVDAIHAFLPGDITRNKFIGVDRWVLAFTLGISIITGIFSALAPAWYGTKPNLNQTLKESGKQVTAGFLRKGLRGFLVVFEVAVAVVLLIGAGLLVKSFVRLQQVDPGFKPDNVLTMTISLPAKKYAEGKQKNDFFQQALERINTINGVKVAGAVTDLPFSGSRSRSSFEIEGRPSTDPNDDYTADNRVISPGYFQAMGMTLLEGRDFTERDNKEAQGAIIINQSMARIFFPNENPLGKRINVGTPEETSFYGKPVWREIVGIVADIKHQDLQATSKAEMYVPFLQHPAGRLMLVVRQTAGATNPTAAIREAIQSIDKDLPVYGVSTMERRLSQSILPQRLNMWLILIFAATALVLAAIGLYGVLSYSVAESTREIGIRMAIGARPADILKLIISQGMTVLAIGLVIGLGLAFALTRLMESLLFGVTATDALTFVSVSLLLATVALLACLIPARRAARVDPMVALRYE
jgi:putative ABC transport system permease protein